MHVHVYYTQYCQALMANILLKVKYALLVASGICFQRCIISCSYIFDVASPWSWHVELGMHCFDFRTWHVFIQLYFDLTTIMSIKNSFWTSLYITDNVNSLGGQHSDDREQRRIWTESDKRVLLNRVDAHYETTCRHSDEREHRDGWAVLELVISGSAVRSAASCTAG